MNLAETSLVPMLLLGLLLLMSNLHIYFLAAMQYRPIERQINDLVSVRVRLSGMYFGAGW